MYLYQQCIGHFRVRLLFPTTEKRTLNPAHFVCCQKPVTMKITNQNYFRGECDLEETCGGVAGMNSKPSPSSSSDVRAHSFPLCFITRRLVDLF